MAPALTETNQEDNFKLPHSPNATTIINPGITQSSSDRYPCNIPFQILPTKCNIFIGNISSSDVELNCYTSDKLASNNPHLNGNSMLEKSRITSDSFHSLSTVFGNANLRNVDSLTNGVVGKDQEKGMKSISHDVCELSKLVARKLVHSDVNMHCIDNVYMNDKNLRTDTTNTLPIKINGELITDSTGVSHRDDCAVTNSSNVANEEKLWTEASRRMEKLQRYSAKLMKRIRHLQMQKATTHVKNEIGSFVSYGQRRLDAHQDNHKRLKLSQKPLTTRVLNVPQLEKKRFHYLRDRQLSTTVPTNETKASNRSDNAYVRIDPKDCAEINRTVGTLRFNLSHLRWSVDSDITDSSSGGESCEEAEEMNEKKKNQVPMCIHFVAKMTTKQKNVEIVFPAAIEMPSITSKFSALSKDNFPGIINVIDCSHMTTYPDSEKAQFFIKRKSSYSISIQVVSDPSMFTWNIVACWPGSTHDRNFDNSSIKNLWNVEQSLIFSWLQ